MVTVELDVGKLTGQVLRLAGFNKLAEKHMRIGGKQGVKLLAGEWKKAAPRETGRYAGSITGRVKSVTGLEVMGVVGTNVNNRGYPYPRLLEYSPKHHYQSTSRSGQPTAGKAKKAIDGAEKNVFKLINKALDKLAVDLIFK